MNPYLTNQRRCGAILGITTNDNRSLMTERDRIVITERMPVPPVIAWLNRCTPGEAGVIADVDLEDSDSWYGSIATSSGLPTGAT